MKNKKYQSVHCYYCGRLVRLDKAIVLNISPKIKLDIPEAEGPKIVLTAPVKIYICPACARYRGISRKDIKSLEREKDLLKKLGIEM